MRIVGFNERGEARIVDHDGRVVGYGEVRLCDADTAGIERGDRFDLEVVITWTAAELPDPAEDSSASLPDPDDVDFDGLDWDQLLR